METKLTKTIKKWMPTIIFLVLIIIVVDTIGIKSLWYLLAAIILFTAYALYTKWSSYKLAMQTIETKIYGRPLEKEYWQDGEKPPKVKLVWKK